MKFRFTEYFAKEDTCKIIVEYSEMEILFEQVQNEINYKSAIEYHDHVSKYIDEELKFGAMYSPFVTKPFDCHISPFLTRHKSNSDKGYCRPQLASRPVC